MGTGYRRPGIASTITAYLSVLTHAMHLFAPTPMPSIGQSEAIR